MSEAMSSVEIEDVLSSIRRLVSEDLRPAPKPVAAPKADDKLLLTPAFRVVADRDPAPTRPTPLPRLHLGVAVAPDEKPREELVATLQRAVEAQDIEWESEVGDPLPPVAAMEWTDDGWAAPGDPTPVEATVDPWNQPEPETAFAPADLAPISDMAEPDAAWADQAEAEVVAQLQEPQPERRQTETRRAEEMIFDEQVLRDLVRDLLREELQGDMGERITRNVRKLVRAEISRMIASQDLD